MFDFFDVGASLYMTFLVRTLTNLDPTSDRFSNKAKYSFFGINNAFITS